MFISTKIDSKILFNSYMVSKKHFSLKKNVKMYKYKERIFWYLNANNNTQGVNSKNLCLMPFYSKMVEFGSRCVLVKVGGSNISGWHVLGPLAAAESDPKISVAAIEKFFLKNLLLRKKILT